jgi:hypothetical protein
VDQDYGGCESSDRVQEEAQKQDGTGTVLTLSLPFPRYPTALGPNRPRKKDNI